MLAVFEYDTGQYQSDKEVARHEEGTGHIFSTIACEGRSVYYLSMYLAHIVDGPINVRPSFHRTRRAIQRRAWYNRSSVAL